MTGQPMSAADASTGAMVRSRILAIDPGTEESGYCVFADGRVVVCGTASNDTLVRMLPMQLAPGHEGDGFHCDTLAIEMVASYGMAVGKDVFETVRWIGRFQQAWPNPDAVRLVYRADVKMHLCHTMKAKDPNIRAALIDLLGAPGTKKSPSPTYGVSGHAWSALAVAVTAAALTKVDN